MNRTSSVAIGSILVFAMTVAGQETKTTGHAGVASGNVAGSPHDNGVPGVDDQMKLLTPRLDLTSDQQPKVKAILQDMHDGTQKLVQDESMSSDQRTEGVRALRYKTDERIREILSDEQKKKLDQVEQEPHPELHGNLR